MGSETQRIVDQVLAGDAEAFSTLVRTHHRRVRHYVAAALGSADGADDIAQEVFLEAYRDLIHYPQAAPFEAWLLGIARHRVLRQHRRRGQDQRLLRQVSQTLMARLEINDSPPWLATDAAAIALGDCVKNLPQTHARLVQRHYFDQQPLVALANEFGRSAGALRVALLRTRMLLRACIASAMGLGRDAANKQGTS